MKIFSTVGNEAGLWYCLVDNQDQELAVNRVAMIWEAWAWEGQSEPPQMFKQDGYRWSRLAEEYL